MMKTLVLFISLFVGLSASASYEQDFEKLKNAAGLESKFCIVKVEMNTSQFLSSASNAVSLVCSNEPSLVLNVFRSSESLEVIKMGTIMALDEAGFDLKTDNAYDRTMDGGYKVNLVFKRKLMEAEINKAIEKLNLFKNGVGELIE